MKTIAPKLPLSKTATLPGTLVLRHALPGTLVLRHALAGTLVLRRALAGTLVLGALALTLSAASPALAADPPAPPADPAAPAPPAPAEDSASPPPAKTRGAFVAGAKVGGIAPFDGLGPFVVATVEVGYVLPWLDRGLAGLVDVSYTAPTASGEQADPRVPGGKYTWQLTQHELVIQPTILYRYTGLGRVVPFIGIGPRIYLMKSVVTGKAGDAVIGETDEPSTQIGGAVPLGVEFQLGPGALLAELLFEIGTLDHSITGQSHTGGGTLNLGYRFLL